MNKVNNPRITSKIQEDYFANSQLRDLQASVDYYFLC